MRFYSCRLGEASPRRKASSSATEFIVPERKAAQPEFVEGDDNIMGAPIDPGIRASSPRSLPYIRP